MFEARLVEGNTFKSIIEAIKDLVTDGNIDITEQEVAIQSMDSSHVALVAVNLSASAFDHYRVDKPLGLGFNSANMAKILKMMGKQDIMVMKAEDDGDKLSMMFENPKTETIADFELKLMEVEVEQLTIPETDFKSTITMPASEFQRIVRDLQVLGDACVISCNKEGIQFSVSGSIGTGNILIRSNPNAEKEEDKVEIDMQEEVELNFALRYLNFFTKATPLSDKVVISLSPELPMCVEYPIEDQGSIKFFLAPKIEDDDEDEDED